MHAWEARAKLLEAENDTLREEVRALRRTLMEAGEPPPFFGLTNAELAMFGVLMNNRAPRVDAFMAGLYSDQADEPPDEKILDVWICKMRS